MAYCDKPDGTLHKFGTDSEEARDYVLDAEAKVKALCEKLPEDTILIISADHGHMNIEKAYSLQDYPEIEECLYMPVSLESRTVNFYVKENMKKEFEERFNNVFKDRIGAILSIVTYVPVLAISNKIYPKIAEKIVGKKNEN